MLSSCNYGPQWFAVQVRTRTEHRVSEILRSKGYEEFLPTTPVWQPHTKFGSPLFPGYVFCRLKSDLPGKIVTTPGVIRIVSFGGKPVPVDPEEMKSLQLLVSSGVSASAHEGLHQGMKVKVEEGPLRGVTGILHSIFNRKGRLLVCITMLTKAVAVEVDAGWVTPFPGEPLQQSAVLVRSASDICVVTPRATVGGATELKNPNQLI